MRSETGDPLADPTRPRSSQGRLRWQWRPPGVRLFLALVLLIAAPILVFDAAVAPTHALFVASSPGGSQTFVGGPSADPTSSDPTTSPSDPPASPAATATPTPLQTPDSTPTPAATPSASPSDTPSPTPTTTPSPTPSATDSPGDGG